MFKLLHVWSSKEATGNEEKKKGCDVKKIVFKVLQCVKLKKNEKIK